MRNKTVFASVGLVFTVALSGCVTIQQKINSALQPAAPVAADTPPVNQPNAAAPAASQKAPVGAVAVQSVVNPGGQPDWSKLFKSWENGCTNSPALDVFFKQFTAFGKDSVPKLAKVNLPALYKSATGAPTSKTPTENKANIYTFTLPVTAGSYYGFPVKSIEQFIGDENGYSGYILFLHASAKDVQQALKKQKVVFKKRKDWQVEISGDAKLTQVLCNMGE